VTGRFSEEAVGNKQGKLPSYEEAPHPGLAVTAPDASGHATLTLEMWGEAVLTIALGLDDDWPAVMRRVRDEVRRRCEARGFGSP
jgi:hypothetical protein